VRLFHARFDPPPPRRAGERDARETEIGPRSRARCKRSKASARIASCALSRQIAVRRGERTNFLRSMPPARRSPSSPSSYQPTAGRRAAAKAALTNFRLFAAGGGRASAASERWRAAASVGPTAAGFPHRDSGPGQGAAGQERRHRPVGPKAASSPSCCPRVHAKPSRRREPPPTSCSYPHCSHITTIWETRA